MLLTKFVNTTWHPQNRKYYEGCGYIFTSYGDNFDVNVNDLFKSNKSKVKVKCDYCGKVYEKTYVSYKKQIIKWFQKIVVQIAPI